MPDRFINHNSDKEKTKAYYPFGGGPRLCIGNNFALAEMALFLKTFIHQFNVNTTDKIPKMRAMVTLRPEGVVVGVERK